MFSFLFFSLCIGLSTPYSTQNKPSPPPPRRVFGHYKLQAAVFGPQFSSRKNAIEQVIRVETPIPDGLSLAAAVEIIPEPGAEEVAEQEAEKTAQSKKGGTGHFVLLFFRFLNFFRLFFFDCCLHAIYLRFRTHDSDSSTGGSPAKGGANPHGQPA